MSACFRFHSHKHFSAVTQRALAAACTVCFSRTATYSSSATPVKTAILMLNMGGPRNLEETEPFLTRLFLDEDIISLPFQSMLGPYIARRRTPDMKQKYAKIGGSCTSFVWTTKQGQLMTELLDKISPETGPHKHYVGFRYADPLSEDSLLQIEKDGAENTVLFSQYAQYSCCTNGSNLNAIARFYENRKATGKWTVIDRWPVHSGLIESFACLIKAELDTFPEEVRGQVVLLFSAHSLPMKVVNRGDPYPTEVAATTVAIMEKLNYKNPYSLVWQSKVGPLPWLRPTAEETLKALVRKGQKHVLLVPVSFVNEHIETLGDIDIELKDVAEKAGIVNFRRTPTPNDHPAFIQGLADLVISRLKSQQKYSPQLLQRCPLCFKSSCEGMRQWVKSLP
ncbi:ferrochelatase, mitochondrial-like [Ornithodoros turicata]|uniref:ferrochelatase, mitochondrial-like n=1 Tax=Ornithodoros turicata TaxID=34597 RepID=UPI0031388BAC